MRVPYNKTIQKAKPTLTHMALAELMRQDLLKYIISQNIDGLHRRSGIDPNKLADLHGNTNIEVCTKCRRSHMRDYRVRTSDKVKEHLTGRKCDTTGCRGDLRDTMVNFGESLNQNKLEEAGSKAITSDLLLSLGSSMRVAPAPNMVNYTKSAGGKVVIINL